MIKAFFSILIFTTLSMTVKGQDGNQILGIWVSGTEKAHIEIYNQKDRFMGKIIWLKTPLNELGKPKTDRKNPEAALRDRPMIGMTLLNNFEYEGEKEYGGGTIYDPESGKTYRCEMKLKSNDILNVRGYIGISLIGRTEVWKRVK